MVAARVLSLHTPSWKLSARALAREIADGRRTAVDVVEEHIARLEACAHLNALCVERFSEARIEARAADAKRGSGVELGALHGVPITVKESLDVEGTASTFGMISRKDHRATRDCDVVKRLRDAGAIILGKTNVAQALLYFESDNPLYGRTDNPWSAERSPGGSSGGQAALVAAGASSIGLGTDLGGSARIPSAFCGVVGFKPTSGRIDDPGRHSVGLGQRAIPSQIGVIARDVDDAALALRIAHGAPREIAVLGDPADVVIKGLRIRWFDDDEVFSACPAARRAVREAKAALEARGAIVTSWKPPHLQEIVAIFFGILSGDGGQAGFVRSLGDSKRDPRIKLLELVASAPSFVRALLKVLLWVSGRKKTAASLDAFGFTSAADQWRLVERLNDVRAAFLEALGDADAILSPASALPAVRHGATADLSVMGAYTCMYNALGLPAGVVPMTTVRADEESDRAPSKDPVDVTARETERGSAGLPIAVQVAARPFCDHVALAVMKAIEDGATDRPSLGD